MTFYRRCGKRLLDFCLALLAAVLLLVPMAVVALLVRVCLGSPILFRQQRPGWLAQPFTILKFRTLTNACDPAGVLLPDSQRLTRFGALLRGTSLDELPELFNVLRGEMSLVGPRPLLMEYLPRYSPEQARRHLVRPGITGWAQVNGRNATVWEKRFELDVWYVDHHNFSLDLRILLRTILKVLTREGIAEPGQATRQPFAGSALR